MKFVPRQNVGFFQDTCVCYSSNNIYPEICTWLAIGNSTVAFFKRVIFEEDVAHSGNHSDGCHPRISQNKAAFKDVLNLMNSNKKKVIDLHFWIESENSTINNTQPFKGIKWANEIGRTLIWLIANVGDLDSIIAQACKKSTLIAGVHTVNVRMLITEKTKHCVLEKNKTVDQTIFHLFMHQLHHISGNSTSYRLCRLYNDKNYNCCTIAGKNYVLICSDYSSIATESLSILALLLALFGSSIGLPMTLYYFNRHQKSNTHYKISHSPMSLLSIAYIISIEGKGSVKSFLRKCAFAAFVLVMFSKRTVYSYFILGFWAFIFIQSDILCFNTKGTDNEITIFTMTFGSLFEIIALPFNVKMLMKKLNPMRMSKDALVRVNSEEVEESSMDENREIDSQEIHNHYGILQIIKYCLITVLYLTALPFLCLFTLILLTCYCGKSLYSRASGGCIVRLLKVVFNCLTLHILIISMQNLFLSMFYVIVGLIFNAEIYSPYYVPLSTILFYAWVNWRSSVEVKYLLLVTSIYKVCKEQVDNKMSENVDNEITENDNDANNMSESKTTPGNLFKIEFDEDGVPAIPKKLYDLVREKFLPYDRVLFFYFQGVFFVVIFSYILFIVISLAQTSGISNNVQIIGTIAATSLPFIFDLVWEKNSDEQKAANKIALKSRLRRVLRVHSSDRVTGEIIVEYNGDNMNNWGGYEKI